MNSIRRFAWPLLLVLAFAAGASWHIAIGQDVRRPLEKWEFTSAMNPDGKYLRATGEDGWELVTVWNDRDAGPTYYFKRRK